jgi:hypothetical protein
MMTQLTISRAFPFARCPGFMVMTPLFLHLSITLSNQRFSNCSPIVDVGFVKLKLATLCGNRVFKMNINFCCPLCCSSRNSPPQCTTISFCQCWFSATVPLRWCCFPMICLRRHNLTKLSLSMLLICWGFYTDAPAKRTWTICTLSKSDKSPIFRFF